MTREQLIRDLEMYCEILEIYYQPNYDGSTPPVDWFKGLIRSLKDGAPIDD